MRELANQEARPPPASSHDPRISQRNVRQMTRSLRKPLPCSLSGEAKKIPRKCRTSTVYTTRETGLPRAHTDRRIWIQRQGAERRRTVPEKEAQAGGAGLFASGTPSDSLLRAAVCEGASIMVRRPADLPGFALWTSAFLRLILSCNWLLALLRDCCLLLEIFVLRRM